MLILCFGKLHAQNAAYIRQYRSGTVVSQAILKVLDEFGVKSAASWLQAVIYHLPDLRHGQ
jgi:hypothetical protein